MRRFTYAEWCCLQALTRNDFGRFRSFRKNYRSMRSPGETNRVQKEEVVFFSPKMARKMTTSNVSLTIVWKPKMDNSQEDVSLTSFRPLSPDETKSTFSLARFFQRKRPEAGVTVKVDTPTTQSSVSPQLQNRGSAPSTRNPDPQRSSSTSSPLIGPRTNYHHGGPVVGGRIRQPSSAGSRNVHAVLGRLNAAAGGRGQVRIHI